MPFQPNVGQQLEIDGITYKIAEHPAAPGMPYGQEGRQAVVYKLLSGSRPFALKVFKARYRLPSLVRLSGKLSDFSKLPGLQVCNRTVLTPQKHIGLLRQYPDLTYAVLMPWIEGTTWMEVLMDGQELSPEASLGLAQSFLNILSAMEQEGIAHCDLSGPNLLLPVFARSQISNLKSKIELVDVEQLFGPGLDRPEAIPAGSPGYAHKTASDGLWGTRADRFAGAVLVGEMLGWCDKRVRKESWGESYFDLGELQRKSNRYQLMEAVLRERWGNRVATLFEQAWESEELATCPTFGEWLLQLPESATPQPSTGTINGFTSNLKLAVKAEEYKSPNAFAIQNPTPEISETASVNSEANPPYSTQYQPIDETLLGRTDSSNYPKPVKKSQKKGLVFVVAAVIIVGLFILTGLMLSNKSNPVTANAVPIRVTTAAFNPTTTIAVITNPIVTSAAVTTLAPSTAPVSGVVVFGVGTTRRGDGEVVNPSDATEQFTVGEKVFAFINYDGATPNSDSVTFNLTPEGGNATSLTSPLTKKSGFQFVSLGKLPVGNYGFEVKKGDSQLFAPKNFSIIPAPTATPVPTQTPVIAPQNPQPATTKAHQPVPTSAPTAAPQPVPTKAPAPVRTTCPPGAC